MQYTLTLEEVAFGTWLTSILPPAYADRVVSADNRGPRLDYPYATFKVVSDTQNAVQASSKLTSVPGTLPGTFELVVATTNTVLLSVNVYGPSSYSDLRRAVLNFQAGTVVEQAIRDGVSVQSAGTVRRLPGDGATTREDRAQIDFTAQYVATVTVDQEATELTTGSTT